MIENPYKELFPLLQNKALLDATPMGHNPYLIHSQPLPFITLTGQETYWTQYLLDLTPAGCKIYLEITPIQLDTLN